MMFRYQVDVGKGFTVEFTFKGLVFDCKWTPRIPTGKQVSQVMPAYKTARNAFIADIAEKTGVKIGVIEP